MLDEALAILAAAWSGAPVHHRGEYYTVDGIEFLPDPAPYAAAGATWWLTDFAPEAVSLDEVRGVLRDGPPEPAVTGI